MKILVCGGRKFKDAQIIFRVLDKLSENWPKDTVIVEGDARGADRIAGAWAISRGFINRKFPADWKKHGVAAGPIRNQQMIAECQPDGVIAFPGGSGTADMVRRAQKAGIAVQEIEVKED